MIRSHWAHRTGSFIELRRRQREGKVDLWLKVLDEVRKDERALKMGGGCLHTARWLYNANELSPC